MAYGYRALLTIDHTVVGSTLTDFPVVFLGDSHLKTVGNGGYLINLDSGLPADLIVTSDSGGMTTVPFEIVAGTYVATTGAMELHFLVSSVSHTVDTVYYLWVGNAAVTTYQGSDAATWTSYSNVYHLPNGSSLSAVDSTGHANGSFVNTPTAVAGQIDGAAGFNGTNTGIQAAGTAGIPGTGPLTWSCWVKADQHRDSERLLLYRHNDIAMQQMAIEFDVTGFLRGDTLDAGGFSFIYSDDAYDDNAWHLIHFVRDTANGVLRLYADGAPATTATSDSSVAMSFTGDLNMGSLDGTVETLNGSMDEVRVTLSALSADWIAAEYANQKTSQTLFTLGPFVPQGGSTPNLMMWFASQ